MSQIDLNDRRTFAKPDQDPAIQGDQHSAQTDTIQMRKLMNGSTADFDPSGLEYEAYKLGQQATGAHVLPKQTWQMMYRNNQMMDGLSLGERI